MKERKYITPPGGGRFDALKAQRWDYLGCVVWRTAGGRWVKGQAVGNPDAEWIDADEAHAILRSWGVTPPPARTRKTDNGRPIELVDPAEFAVRMERATRDKLDSMARQEGISRAALIRRTLERLTGQAHHNQQGAPDASTTDR